MVRRSVFVVAVTLLSITACQRLQDTRPFERRGPGALPVEQASYRDAIPAAYGDLIGVTSRPDYPGWTQAWFVKADKSLVVVWVNSLSGDLYEKVVVIPRR